MSAKIVVLVAFFGMVYCGITGDGRNGIVSGLNRGVSDTYRRQQPSGQYSFGYDIVGHEGAKNSRHETGGPGHAVGSYQIQDIDGRERTVSYVADQHGFRAVIQSNEPGVVQHTPAAAAYTGPRSVSSFSGVQAAGHEGQINH